MQKLIFGVGVWELKPHSAAMSFMTSSSLMKGVSTMNVTVNVKKGQKPTQEQIQEIRNALKYGQFIPPSRIAFVRELNSIHVNQ